jgi:hypothetical protein
VSEARAHNESAARYCFGPRDRRGLIAGVRTGQACILAGGLGLSVLVARVARPTVGVPIAALVGIASVAIAFVPLWGRAFDEWVPVVASYVLAGVVGGRRHRFLAGVAPARRRPPRPFADLRVVEVEPPGRPAFGAVEDRRDKTLTGVLSLFGASAFALADSADQDRQVAAWSSVLASLAAADQSLIRLQWVERTLPEEPAPWPSGLAFVGAGPAARSYRGLLRPGRTPMRHELLLAASVPLGRRARLLERSGAQGATSAGSVLARVLAGLESRLVEAGIGVNGALAPGELRATLRRSFELGPLQGPSPRNPWPARLEVRWSKARAGETLVRTYWIAEWPRSEVKADFLLPLLLVGDERRALSLVMVPVAPERALRAAEHARTSGAADEELRARHGFAQTARARRQHEAVVQREVELALGHGAFRFSGYLAVSAADEAALERACVRIEQAAALARLSLQRLDGCQGEALTVCLPLGRGCA